MARRKKVGGRSKSPEGPILLLSSGQSRRYLDDIVRVLALPAGGRIQFRYDQKHIPASLRNQGRSNGRCNHNVLVAYLGVGVPEGEMGVVPCRFGRLVSIRKEGNFVVVNFDVSGFAGRDDGCVLKGKEINPFTSGCLPFKERGKQELGGDFCHLLTGVPGGFESKGDELGAWQKIVADLRGRREFSGYPFFYTVREVFESGRTERKVPTSKGGYVLRPNRLHGIKLVHYAGEPGSVDKVIQSGKWAIVAEAKGHGVQQLTSQYPLVDSRYDVKTSYFRTSGKVEAQYGVMSVSRKLGGVDAHQDFEISVKVKRALLRPAWIVTLIGIFFAFPRFIELYPLCGTEYWTVAAYFGFGLAVGVSVVFGLRRMP